MTYSARKRVLLMQAVNLSAYNNTCLRDLLIFSITAPGATEEVYKMATGAASTRLTAGDLKNVKTFA